MQGSLFEKEELENWCKYRLKVKGQEIEARYLFGEFVYQWGLLKPEEVDDYTKIGGFEQWEKRQ